MFPKNRISLFYRLLCLISFLLVIIFTNNQISLIFILLMYCCFGLMEKSFRNIEFIIITILILGICYLLNNYWLYKIVLLIDYSYYFLDTSYYNIDDDETIIDKKEYVRFAKVKKKSKKGSNNISAIYVTLHLGLLFMAIVVG